MYTSNYWDADHKFEKTGSKIKCAGIFCTHLLEKCYRFKIWNAINIGEETLKNVHFDLWFIFNPWRKSIESNFKRTCFSGHRFVFSFLSLLYSLFIGCCWLLENQDSIQIGHNAWISLIFFSFFLYERAYVYQKSIFFSVTWAWVISASH